MSRLIGCFRSASLAGQMVGLLLFALALSQGIGFLIYLHERAYVLRGVAKEEFLVRTASIARLLEATPPALHGEVLRAVDNVYTRYWLTTEEPRDAAAWQREAKQYLAEALPPTKASGRSTPLPAGGGIAEASSFPASAAASTPTVPWHPLPAGAWPLARPAKMPSLDEAHGLGLVVRLGNGIWLNAWFSKPISGWSSQSIVSIGLTALALSLIAVLTARRIARPLRHLALAAEHLGRGEEAAPLPEEGPEDIRRTAEAFNRMQARLRRFVEDRTRMLAAIGHDLRTPITSLRLRAEFVADDETRDKLLSTLDEMQAMTEATLAFAREEAAGEATRAVDLAALVESLCADLADLKSDVAFAGGERMPYRCRPDALRRAIRNLIENAVRYGERARVTLGWSGEWLEIIVDDDGPGIPEADFERVFAPFVRLESSRSRETGGVGLGLSIARTIVRGHGGDILLANRPGGGFRGTIRLPRL